MNTTKTPNNNNNNKTTTSILTTEQERQQQQQKQGYNNNNNMKQQQQQQYILESNYSEQLLDCAAYELTRCVSESIEQIKKERIQLREYELELVKQRDSINQMKHDLEQERIQWDNKRREQDRELDLQRENLNRERLQLYEQLQLQKQELLVEKKFVEDLITRVNTTSTMVKNKVKLNVGGSIFTTSIDTLTTEKGTFFSCMFSGQFDMLPDEDGEYFIDREGDLFHLILRHMRGIDIAAYVDALDPREKYRLAQEVLFYGINSMMDKYFAKEKRRLLAESLKALALMRRRRRRSGGAGGNYNEYDDVDGDDNGTPMHIEFKFKASFGRSGSSVGGEFDRPYFVTVNPPPSEFLDDDLHFFKPPSLLHESKKVAALGITDKNESTTTTTTSELTSSISDLSIQKDAVVVAVETVKEAEGAENDDEQEAEEEEVYQIFVSDSNNHRVQIFDSKGNFQRCFGSRGTNTGQLGHPRGIAFDSEGHIIVCEAGNHRIQVFDQNLMHVRSFGTKGFGNGNFSNPAGIAVDSNDNIFVVDGVNHRIQVFSPDGTFQRVIGSGYEGRGIGQGGAEDGKFNTPWAIAIDKYNDRIYICDSGNHQIQVLSPDGEFLFKFGSKGAGDGQFHIPSVIALSEQGHLIVCDTGNSRLQVFDASNGKFLQTFSDSEIIRPSGMAIGGNNTLIVSDTTRNCIKLFQMVMTETPPTTGAATTTSGTVPLPAIGTSTVSFQVPAVPSSSSGSNASI